MNKTRIDLALTNIVGLIVKYASTFEFTNQTNGVCCNHPIQEGIFVPLETIDHSNSELKQAFHRELFDFSEKEADEFDNIFQNLKLPLMVDRSKINESEEAWIHVIVTKEAIKDAFSPYEELENREAILIYPNSD